MSPYKDLPRRNFWKTAVPLQQPYVPEDFYRKKFAISGDTKIATAGSCFAQHIARHMKFNGFNVLDREPAPPGLDLPTANKFGYQLYSARYGNIYVVRHLKQLMQEAFGKFAPRDIVWEKNGRLFDALRPNVEPNGLNTSDEVLLHRQSHLNAVRALFRQVDLLVFTFGLTEGWVHRESGTVYPTAPGTIAGDFNPDKHALKVFTFEELLSDFIEVRNFLKKLNPAAKFLLTVSPVPLTATACESHVAVATMNAKSTLRAVAGQLSADFDDVDYFPSYELVASPFSRGAFYEDNMREVTADGVDAVMQTFFREHGSIEQPADAAATPKQKATKWLDKAKSVCEDLLLDAFAKK